MPVTPVVSLGDSRLNDYRHLADGDLLVRQGLFIAEGRLVVRRLVEGRRFSVRSLLLTPAALAAMHTDGVEFPDVPVFVADPGLVRDIVGFNVHRGCLAVGLRGTPPPWQIITAEASRVLVLEQIGNADNVGGIFRNAAAFAVESVLLTPGCVDPLYRKAIRTSMGAALDVPFAHLDSWPQALDEMRRSGLTLVALTTQQDAPALATVAPGLGRARMALLLGHEGAGLSAEVLERCDVRARIPMADGVDSLNVATASGIALYELRR